VGYYAKTVVEAWDFRNNKHYQTMEFLIVPTTTVSTKHTKVRETTNLSIGDSDGDGKDEITFVGMPYRS
jgi:hypothetical protein